MKGTKLRRLKDPSWEAKFHNKVMPLILELEELGCDTKEYREVKRMVSYIFDLMLRKMQLEIDKVNEK